MTALFIIGIVVLVVSFGVFFGAPYLPTKRNELRAMFDELCPIDEHDEVLDIGSGDGVVLREVSRRGAKAVGIEINPLLVGISRFLSYRDPKVAVRTGNFWTMPFSESMTLIYAFSTTRDGARMERKLQNEANRLQKSLTFVCYGSPLPTRPPVAAFEAYHKYVFAPLHSGEA